MGAREERAPLPTIGILANDDERLRKVTMFNLMQDTTNEELKAWIIQTTGIAESGIVSVEVREPHNKDNPNYKKLADIVFDSTKTTDECIANLYKIDDKERKFKDNTMNMSRTIPDFFKQDKKKKDSSKTKTKKLFVANLPQENTNIEEELKKHIGCLVDSEETQILGTIESYQVIMQKDPETGNRKQENQGIAFIHVSSEQLADKLAIQCGGGFEIGGRRIDVRKNVPKQDAGGMRGRGGPYGGMQGGKGGYAAQQQWGYYGQHGGYPPQGYGPQHGYGQDWGYQQQGYGGYGGYQGFQG